VFNARVVLTAQERNRVAVSGEVEIRECFAGER
jgi:hypothetical protein